MENFSNLFIMMVFVLSFWQSFIRYISDNPIGIDGIRGIIEVLWKTNNFINDNPLDISDFATMAV